MTFTRLRSKLHLPVRKITYTKPYSIGGVGLEMLDPFEMNKPVGEWAIATTTINRDYSGLYFVEELTFVLNNSTQSQKTLETWGNNPQCIDVISEGVQAGTQDYSRATVNRLQEEFFVMAESYTKTFNLVRNYNLLVSKKPISIVAKNIEDPVALGEEVSSTYMASKAENLALKTDILREWGINRTYTHQVLVADAEQCQYQKGITEKIATSDTIVNRKRINRGYCDEIYITEMMLQGQKILRSYADSVCVSGKNISQWDISRTFNGAIVIDDTQSYKQNVKRYYEVGIIARDEKKQEWQVNKKYASEMKVVDAHCSAWTVWGVYKEAVKIEDTVKSACMILRAYNDALKVTEKAQKAISTEFQATVKCDDIKEGLWLIDKTVTETVATSEYINATLQGIIKDGLKIKDGRWRYQTNGVISDIVVNRGELTLDEFIQKADNPAQYNRFIEFKVGDYEYQDAIYKIELARTNLNTKSVLYDYAVHVDIPDTFDRGEAAVDGETNVYFNKHFYHAPEVNVSTTGGTEILIPRIIALDGEDDNGRYFTVILENSSGESKAGRISWSARGY